MTLPLKWQLVETDEELVKDICKRTTISETFAKVLVDRGIVTDSDINRILNPRSEYIHPPAFLPDIDIGFERIKKAIEKGEKILVWGDEDTDGITGTVFMCELLKNLNANVFYHIPSRKEEGIGLNNPGIEKAHKLGYSVIITIDCASSDSAQIAEAKKRGIDVIVTDHHEVLDHTISFPLINPKREDSEYPYRNISGGTVAFKFGSYIAKRLLSLSETEWESIAHEWYPLVFLGLYADRVPLHDENWILSKLGFNTLLTSERMGIKILVEMVCERGKCEEGNIQKMISIFSSAKTKGWGENLGFNILTAKDEPYLRETILRLIKQSDEWHSRANENFRRISAKVNDESIGNILFVYNQKIPFDFLGFCASRLKERYHKPVLIATDKDDIIIGEARAPQNFNVLEILEKMKDLFLSFGGHKPACGFSLKRENLDRLKSHLLKEMAHISDTHIERKELKIIDVLPLENLSRKVKKEVTLLSPFGTGNPPPLFLAKHVPLSKGVYSIEDPKTGEVRRIEIKSSYQTWTGIDGKPITLDIVYYLNSAGVITIADARPSLFNEPLEKIP
jgi:single-stranded-DNA-specific exonuclease